MRALRFFLFFVVVCLQVSCAPFRRMTHRLYGPDSVRTMVSLVAPIKVAVPERKVTGGISLSRFSSLRLGDTVPGGRFIRTYHRHPGNRHPADGLCVQCGYHPRHPTGIRVGAMQKGESQLRPRDPPAADAVYGLGCGF